MRGKPWTRETAPERERITPAHAGKTALRPPVAHRSTDHPRACGENRKYGVGLSTMYGSPPRMRGKRVACVVRVRLHRITPAHAGKTTDSALHRTVFADHPRACGENASMCSRADSRCGSPPRMRGKHRQRGQGDMGDRITPAHAGKTPSISSPAPCPSDHPRACGENYSVSIFCCFCSGSPPRMRGKQ